VTGPGKMVVGEEPSRRRRRRTEVGCKLWMDPLVVHFDFVRLYFDSLFVVQTLLDGRLRLITIQENIT